MSDDVDIDQLVERARRGDAEAFGALYDAFATRLHRFVLFRVGRPAEAEDLVHTVFLKMIEALPRYEPRGTPFAAWLFRLARNATIDWARTRREHATLESLVERPDPARGPDELAAVALTREELGRALRSLTREQQEVIAYRFFAGLSANEIGHLMGKKEATVRGLQFRALEALRRRLGSLGPRFGEADAGEPLDEGADFDGRRSEGGSERAGGNLAGTVEAAER